MSKEFQAQIREAVRDEGALRTALADADIAPMLMVLVQLTGDLAILDEVAPHIHGAWSFLESVPEPLKQKMRDRLVDADDERRRRTDGAGGIHSVAGRRNAAR